MRECIHIPVERSNWPHVVCRNEPRSVIHFFHHKFKRCEIMDKHLQKLAPKYFGTLFIRVFVENVPWLVERLGIKVLPCVMIFVGGTSKDRSVLAFMTGYSRVYEIPPPPQDHRFRGSGQL